MSVATQIERLQGVRNQIRNKMVSLGLSSEKDLLKKLADDLDKVANNGDATTVLSTSTRSKTLAAGYYTGGTISIPSNYYPLTSSNTTATAGTVLSGYKFVNTSGGTVTGTIATATADNVSGSIIAPNPEKITLNTDSTTGSKSATASASVSVAKGLYTGSSNISKPLANQTYTASAEVTLASSVTGSSTIPNTLPTGTVEVTPTTTRTLYSDTSATKGYLKSFVVKGMPKGDYSTTIPSHIVSESTVGSAVSGSITDIATKTQPSGTDKTDYYTITPAIPTVTAGTSSASAKTTINTAGYISTGTETNDTKPVPIKTSPGSSYYLKASSFGEVVGTDPNTNLTAIRTITPSAKTEQYILIPAGYTPVRKIKVEKIPSPYYNTSGVTATAGTTLSGYKFVNASGATITGTIATADSSNILASGSTGIGISPNSTITLNTDKTSDSKTVTATGAVSVAKGFYTGTSNISKTLENKSSKVTANVNLASSVSASDTIPTTGSGIVKVSPNTAIKAYSDTSNTKGFIKTFIVEGMPKGEYSASVSDLKVSVQPKATPSITGSITNIATTTKPSGTDNTNYYTITPGVTTNKGTAATTAKATISTAGYIAAGNDTASDTKDIIVDTSGKVTPYYLETGAFTSSLEDHKVIAPVVETSISGSITSIATTAKPSGTDGADYYTISPSSSLATEGTSKAKARTYITTAGYIPVTLNASPDEGSLDFGYGSAPGPDYYLKAGKYSPSVTFKSTSSASAKPKIAGDITNIAITTRPESGAYYTITPDFESISPGSVTVYGTATIETAGYITTESKNSSNSTKSITVNPLAGNQYFLPIKHESFTPTLAGKNISPDSGLLTSVTVTPIPYIPVTLSADGWVSTNNISIGQYYYDVNSSSITFTNNLYVKPNDDSISLSQSFGVYAYSQSDGVLQFRAMEKPTSDLAYTIYYLS